MKFAFFSKRLRGIIVLFLLGVFLMLGITGCDTKEVGVITGIRFERGHGSMWGNQFYIEVRTDEIREARFFPEGGQNQVTREHIPVSAQQWEALCRAVDALELVEYRTSFWQKLFGNKKLDGGEYRTLTLIRQNGATEEETVYRWPSASEALALETLLEQLTATLHP